MTKRASLLTAIFATSAAAATLGSSLSAQVQQQLATLPAPFATPSVTNGPRVVSRPEGATLKLPAGFQVEEWLDGFQVPRFMLIAPGGEVLISDSADGGGVYAITASKEKKLLVDGLDRPYGLALWKDYLYIGERTSIKRYKFDSRALRLGAGEEIASLANFKISHWTRSLLFDAKGEKLYVGIGSGSNVDTGEDPMRAAINRYNPDGSGHELYAQGTRNPIGLHWYPGTNTLWAGVQERDGLGDDLVPDYLTHIQQGAFYGWPYAYSGPHEEPRHKGEKPELVAKAIPGDVLLQSHGAVLDFTFYTGKMFPKEYQGGAFVALHGSWNRSKRVGYEIAFVPFANQKPSGPVQEFMTGWMTDRAGAEVWGRPVAILQLPDGSLLVSDDGGKKIWRISYKK